MCFSIYRKKVSVLRNIKHQIDKFNKIEGNKIQPIENSKTKFTSQSQKESNDNVQ